MRRDCLTLAASLLVSLGGMCADAQEVLRDPTRPFYAKRAPAAPDAAGRVASFSVTAIFTSDLRRVAVVNGQRVTEGDRVDGATVIEILRDRLRLNIGGKVITTRVLPYEFRK